MPTSKFAEADGRPLLITMGETRRHRARGGVRRLRRAWRARRQKTVALVGDADVLGSCGVVPPEAIVQTKARATRKPGKADPANAAATIEAITLAVEMTLKARPAP